MDRTVVTEMGNISKCENREKVGIEISSSSAGITGSVTAVNANVKDGITNVMLHVMAN